MTTIEIYDYATHRISYWVNHLYDNLGNGGSGICADRRTYTITNAPSDLSIATIDSVTGEITIALDSSLSSTSPIALNITSEIKDSSDAVVSTIDVGVTI